jgi:hypothetical protein
MLDYAVKDNPFPADARKYPVELPSASSSVFTINIDVPEGYEVGQLPKPARIKLNDNDGSFEYLIGVMQDRVQLRCRLEVNKAVFEPDAYDNLRGFYESIIKKEAEPIVFRRVKS